MFYSGIVPYFIDIIVITCTSCYTRQTLIFPVIYLLAIYLLAIYLIAIYLLAGPLLAMFTFCLV